jgi:hypothetical protein
VFLAINSDTCNGTEGERKLIYFPQLLILISLSILFMLCHGILHFEISVIVFPSDNGVWKIDKYEFNVHVGIVYDAVRR